MSRELAETPRWAARNRTLSFIKAILASQTGVMKTFSEAEAVSHSCSTQNQLKSCLYHADRPAAQQPQARVAPAEEGGQQRSFAAPKKVRCL